MEHQIEITVSEHGREPENGDRLLGAFFDLQPDTEVVIDQSVESGELSATFIVDAEGAEEAFRLGADLFTSAAVNASLDPTRVLFVSAAACAAEEQTDEVLVTA